MVVQSNEISVVVQGAIDKKQTPKCLKAVRKHLPHAEIILSTWEGSDIKGLDFDVLLLNQDPGDVTPDFPSPMTNNTNRQLVSTQKGLAMAKRPYTLKLRSDLILTSNKFLAYFDIVPHMDEASALFERRVLVDTLFSRRTSCLNGVPMLFHPSDWWFFGLTADLNRYFQETPLLKQEDKAPYQYLYPEKMPYSILNVCGRYAPEQYFCISAVKRKFPSVVFEDWTDWNQINIEQSRRILTNSFVFLDFEQHGIYPKKYRRQIESFIPGLMTFETFLQDYIIYCDPSFLMPLKYRWQKTLKIEASLRNLCESRDRFIRPLVSLFYWVLSPVFMVLYFIKTLTRALINFRHLF